MHYQILDLKSKVPLDRLELHVLARAYYAAWNVIHGTAPKHWHPMPMFNVVFDFCTSTVSSGQSDDLQRRKQSAIEYEPASDESVQQGLCADASLTADQSRQRLRY